MTSAPVFRAFFLFLRFQNIAKNFFVVLCRKRFIFHIVNDIINSVIFYQINRIKIRSKKCHKFYSRVPPNR